MEKSKCRTATLVATNIRKGVVMAKLLECNRLDCPHCLENRVEFNLNLITKPMPMALVWTRLSERDSGNAKKAIQRAGGFFWDCPLQGGGHVFLSDRETRHSSLWIPAPTSNDEEMRFLLRGWISSRDFNRNISHTRGAVPKSRKLEEDKNEIDIIGERPELVKKIAMAGGMKEKSEMVFVAPSSGSFAGVDSVRNEIKRYGR